MAKKKRSAKQLANDRRLGAAAKARAKPKPKKRSSKPRKVNKRKAPRRTMAKRRAPSRSRSITSKIPFVNNPTVKKAAMGVGLATIGITAISLVAPQIVQNPIIRPALAFLGGGVPGVVAQVVVQGGLGGLSNIFGAGNGGGGSGAFTPGFG